MHVIQLLRVLEILNSNYIGDRRYDSRVCAKNISSRVAKRMTVPARELSMTSVPGKINRLIGERRKKCSLITDETAVMIR